MKNQLSLLWCAALFIGSGCSQATQKTVHQEAGVFTKVLQDDGVIWGFDFLPNGDVLYTLRSGKIKRFDAASNKTIEIKNAPEVVAEGQGGLLDIVASPSFESNRTLFMTFSGRVSEGVTTQLMKAKLARGANKLIERKVIFSGKEANDKDIHFGSRIVFAPDGSLFFTMGDRNVREHAQQKDKHQGSVLRILPNGRPHPENPFQQSGPSEVWSIGHRNPQGIDFDPQTGKLWAIEFGPRGGDELNLIKKAGNYGWPEVSYGNEYYGPSIGGNKTHQQAGMIEPVRFWVPSISPSGMAFYNQGKHKQWKGSLFIANLASAHVRRLKIENDKVVSEHKLLEELGERWRHVRVDSNGEIWLSTDSGKLGKLSPGD